jgi:hypothetical protein
VARPLRGLAGAAAPRHDPGQGTSRTSGRLEFNPANDSAMGLIAKNFAGWTGAIETLRRKSALGFALAPTSAGSRSSC